MDPITAAIAQLQTDQAATATATQAKSDADTALAAAQHTSDTAASSLTSAVTQQNADVDAAVALINSTFRVPPAAPPVAPGS